MADRVKLSSLAQKDLENSYDWYESQQAGMGGIFAEAIYDAANSILKQPATYPTKKANTREFSLSKYPFVIVYDYNQKGDFLKVLRIFIPAKILN